MPVEILYPALDFRQFDENDSITDPKEEQEFKQITAKKYFFSLNRYERKKDIGLAIQAYADLAKKDKKFAEEYNLVIAGGYDKLVSENIEYHK